MFGRRKPSISDTLKDWIVESFDWADATFGPSWSISRELITPSRDFFTAPSGSTSAIAQQTADDIARLLPVPSIPVEPIAAPDPEHRHSYQDLTGIGGLYYHDEDAPLITYDATLMGKPMSFINTMTHELMHARLERHVDDMPGGEGAHELSTDLHCITHGFGIFALEGPSQQGWSGYMTQESRSYALAVFLSRHQIDAGTALRHLSARPQKALKRAVAEYVYDRSA